MNFAPDLSELLARARADLRTGVPVVLNGAAPVVAAAAETLNASRLEALRSFSPDPVVAITARRAATLKAHAYDGDLARVMLPKDADLAWVQGIADPSSDLENPMKGPLHCQRDGDTSAFRLSLRLAKSARLLPATVCSRIQNPIVFASENALCCIDVDQATGTLTDRSPLHPVISARLPMEVSETGRLHVFRPEDGGEEHYAIEIGRPDRHKPVLTRLHSACFTGDLLGSLKCDCGPQLRAALAQMGAEGSGILLYMNQEGRGIGLANKMRAYSLQDQGFDTVEANHRLGFEDDERDFRLGADILRTLGFSQARLLTNNPQKVKMLQASGIEVTERVPLRISANRHNKRYLATKVERSGHLK
ncbi:MAG: GTP cyclohydrolase II [Roseobacter sp.]|jgi:GTP cyclohydrolase II